MGRIPNRKWNCENVPVTLLFKQLFDLNLESQHLIHIDYMYIEMAPLSEGFVNKEIVFQFVSKNNNSCLRKLFTIIHMKLFRVRIYVSKIRHLAREFLGITHYRTRSVEYFTHIFLSR